MEELTRIVTTEYALEITSPDGDIKIVPCSLKNIEEEKVRLSAVPLLGDPLKVRVLSRMKITVINATTWVASETEF